MTATVSERTEPTAAPATHRGLVERGRRALRHPVVGVGLVMVLAQLVFRGWAVIGGSFYADDWRLVAQARESALSVQYLLAPYDSQFMPLGRLGAWVASRGGDDAWLLAAGQSLLWQAVASAACLGMLVTLFGRRWEILLLLALYLTTCLNIEAFMWWAASLNQMPLQAVLFAAVATWVQHLRTRRRRWTWLTLALITLGLAAYPKTLIAGLVLAWLAVAYFTTGTVRQRVSMLWRGYAGAISLGAALAGGYYVYYSTVVPQAFTQGDTAWGALAANMFGRAFGPTLVGGPWSWGGHRDGFMQGAPASVVSPPEWALGAAWLVILQVILFIVHRRRRTLRAWALLVTYLAVLFVMLGTTRAPAFGSDIALHLRYLTDAAPVVVLCLGLATLELRGASSSSARRPGRASVRLGSVGLAAVVGVSSVVSTVAYMESWHSINPGKRYAENLRTSLGDRRVDLANTVVPENVMTALAAPANTTSYLAPLIAAGVAFPATTPALSVVNTDGTVYLATLADGAAGEPGPVRECGHRIDGAPTTIPLARAVQAVESDDWWLRLGYIASDDTDLRVVAGDTTTTAELVAGLKELFVKVNGDVNEVVLSGVDEFTTVCVGDVQVGRAVPGASL